MAGSAGTAARWRAAVVPGGVAVLSVLLLGPALAPGYTLIGDQVFVPDQSLLPWMLGLGGGLPRSVPQDAVVALLTGPVPGAVWEKVALLGALLLLGTGVARLLHRAPLAARAVAAVVAVWSPYVAERLLLGHWSLLLAVSVLPWALAAADDARRGVRAAPARWVLWVALASLTPTGGLLVLLTSAPVLAWRGASRGPRLGVLAAGLALQLPWLVPALLHPGTAAPGGSEVFALRPEGWWGALVTALGTGGAWNADAVPASRGTLVAPLATVVLLALAWYGRRELVRALGRPATWTLLVPGAVLLAVVVAGAWSPTQPLLRVVVESVPGGGLLRDGQKWLAPWLLLLACAAGTGAARLMRRLGRRTGDATVGHVVLAGLLLLPVAALPDLAWGAQGRLATTTYPHDWAEAREVLANDPAPGDVVSLPWSTFRRFDWNRGRTVLDPASRAMPRPVVADDTLVVARGDDLMVVRGDDPRAAEVAPVVDDPARLAAVLQRSGVGWALVAHVETPATVLPAGAVRVMAGRDLDLYRLAGPAAASVPGAVVVGAVVASDLLALVVLAGALVVAAARRGSIRGPRGRPGPKRSSEG